MNNVTQLNVNKEREGGGEGRGGEGTENVTQLDVNHEREGGGEGRGGDG
jgi:hypothetical protein